MPSTPPSDFGDFIFGVSPFGGSGPSPSPPVNNWPPSGPTSSLFAPPAYLYQQYADDDNVRAFFTAYNIYAQAYPDYFNNLNLPIYTQLSGPLLDWVAAGLYGITRPQLPAGQGIAPMGPYNSWAFNTLPFNGFRPGQAATYTSTSDDTFKRIITWAFWKGDGKTFTPSWLKRRINRFLYGVNGTDAPNPVTYGISAVPTGFKEWTITVPNSTYGGIFKSAVASGALELPFQCSWSVVLA
jgi:hypothetical protein